MPEGLNISTISDMYLECHALAHISSRINADDAVNHCLNSRLQRESQWTHKISHNTQCEQLFLDVLDNHDENLTAHNAKSSLKKTRKQTTLEYWLNHVKNYR